MLNTLLIATKNQGKFSEIAEVLNGMPFGLKSLADLGLDDEVEEHGATHKENAILKARYFFEKTGLPTLGEDSGVYVDAFPGELGVKTRRFRGLNRATDEEWIAFFLKEMADVPQEKRTAKFVCVAALIVDDATNKNPHIFSGETVGVITKNLEAPLKKGIPVSSCFRPEGFDKVYAALSMDEKNRVSHRGKALDRVKDFLTQFLIK